MDQDPSRLGLAADAYFEDHQESGDLGRKAIRGGVVSVAAQYCNGVLQVLATIVLARLLTPADFGLVAIITVITSFAPLLIDFGLGDATAQRSRITPSQISSLFWLATALGVGLAILCAACSPLIAAIYHQPQLEPIALCTGITFVFWGVSNQHLALLRRTMQFGQIAKIQFLATLAGVVVAIALALAGYSYWSLVARPIVRALWVAVASWRACSWRPGPPVFDKEVKSLTRFGVHVVSFSVTFAVAGAVDRMALGLFYPPAVVGYYQNAMTLYQYSVLMALEQVHTVGSAALSKLQFNPAALREKYQAALSTLAYFIMPAAAILSVTADDVTLLLLGGKWRAAGVLLRILALRGIFYIIENSQGWLHLSIGRVDRWRNWGVLSLAFQIVAVLAGLPFGPTGVAVACVIEGVLIAVPSVSYAGRPIGVGAAVVFRAVGPELIGAIATAALGTWLRMTIFASYSSLERIVLATVCCVAIYMVVVVGLFRRTEPLRVARSVVQHRFRSDP